jgi:hypothetical protein
MLISLLKRVCLASLEKYFVRDQTVLSISLRVISRLIRLKRRLLLELRIFYLGAAV